MTDRQEPPVGQDPLDPYADLSDLGAGQSLPLLEDPSIPPAAPPRSPLLTGLIVALLLIVVSIAVFQLLSDDESSESQPVATETTTTATAATSGTSTEGSSASPTAGSTTTSETPSVTTGSVELAGGFEPYQASGDPISLNNLRMAVDSLGPVEFGTEASTAIGRLIVSLGTPDEDTGPIVSTGAFGVCEGDLERIVRWGPFIAIVTIDSANVETFASYRLDFAYAVEGLGSPATELETLSGLKAGQSVVALQEVYEDFDVSFEVDPDLGMTFVLRSSRTGKLLLWGPVTSEDSNGIVLGIYAPDVCQT